ncbi:erythromycin esterase family protein [Dysgonomonas sp. 216]|uniref:erythromycin esterase family protein n=1 Tax=Dysgonomonas sp. 216 TaxID=2302934 RepID=UPI0013D34A82|nr:erythromycin esterase family protein [Dysgonomonas sp. 216]
MSKIITIYSISIFFILYSCGKKGENQYNNYNLTSKDWQFSTNWKIKNDLLKKKSALYAFPERFIIEYKPVAASLHYTTILAKENCPETGKVSILNKCKNIDKATLRVLGRNLNDQLIYEDSLDINTKNCLTKRELKFPLSDIDQITILIEAFGDTICDINTLEDQYICIEETKINFRGEEYDIAKCDTQGSLNTDFISPVSENWEGDSSRFIQSNAVNDFLGTKQIIGIGETLHGSESLNKFAFEFIKDQIINNNCGYVLVELPIDMAMTFNMYVQGQITGEAMKYLHQNFKNYIHISDSVFFDFLQWLRAYNENTTKKVLFWGVDKDHRLMGHSYCFDYLFAVFKSNRVNGQKLLPLLKLVHNFKEDYNSIFSYIDRNEAMLNEILGKQNLKLFIYTFRQYLDNLSIYYDTKREREKYAQIAFRDKLLFKNFRFLQENFVSDDRKILIYYHYGHLNKINSAPSRSFVLSFGYYLNKEFSEKYASIAITTGKGSRMNEQTSVSYYIEELESPPFCSFEYRALNSQYDNFYYPSDRINDNITSMRLLFSHGPKTKHKQFEYYPSIKNRVDGILFIKNSQSIKKEIYDSNKRQKIEEDMYWQKEKEFSLLLK